MCVPNSWLDARYVFRVDRVCLHLCVCVTWRVYVVSQRLQHGWVRGWVVDDGSIGDAFFLQLNAGMENKPFNEIRSRA